MLSPNSTILKASIIIAFVLTVVVNSLAGSTTLIGGRTTADVSNQNPTLITPAGYVFAIWGVIYILLGIFVVYQALPSQMGRDFQRKVGWLFILASAFNITWLFLWQNLILSLSVPIMFLLLASLIAIYLKLNIGKSTAPLREKLAVQAPFSVYLGWITIASIANVAAFLVSVGWDGFGIAAENWAILIIIVALVITLAVVVTRKDAAYALVIVWALTGIAVNQAAHPNIVTVAVSSALLAALVLIAFTIYSWLSHKLV
jgi:benzodiazapine receptor